MDDRIDLARALLRARRRVEDAARWSPEWAAAIEELEELEAKLVSRREPKPSPAV